MDNQKGRLNLQGKIVQLCMELEQLYSSLDTNDLLDTRDSSMRRNLFRFDISQPYTALVLTSLRRTMPPLGKDQRKEMAMLIQEYNSTPGRTEHLVKKDQG